MTGFDYVVLAVTALSLLVGLWRGVVSEILALVAWIVAFFAASTFSGLVAGLLSGAIKDAAVAHVAAFVLVFIAVLMLMALVRVLLKQVLSLAGLGVVDRLLGAVFGLARAALVLVGLVLVGGMTGAPREPWWREATFSPPLETAVIAIKPRLPETLAKRIRFK